MADETGIPARASTSIAFTYNGQEVTFDEKRLINLFELWKAAGSNPSRKPSEWARQSGPKEFIKDLAKSKKVGIAHLWKSQAGIGTWGHWQIALAYAKYLSNDFHRFVNEAFREWSEEKANPDLKAERAVEGYRRKGWADEKILVRLEGIVQRKAFTDTLKDHGVAGPGYAICTDAINKEVLGGSAREIKVARGVPAKATTRDHLESHELAGLRFAEAMAVKRVKDGCSHGNSECCNVCQQAGHAVYQAMASMGLAAKGA